MHMRRSTTALDRGRARPLACHGLGRGGTTTRVGRRTTHVTAPATPQHWDPLTDELVGLPAATSWSSPVPAPTRTTAPAGPFEYAIVTKGPELTDVTIDAEVRLDESVTVSNRDVIVVWNDPGPEALLLRALLAGQHDLSPQRDLRRRQRRPPPHRRPVAAARSAHRPR